ncbi:MAG: hypothetical protein O2819_07380 [Planctomycetota bacterium]|nr:hypothetical protein [Planctomycetota bacterium]MDA1106115.1 hypothetical protein [Planctomycetota bacterium]
MSRARPPIGLGLIAIVVVACLCACDSGQDSGSIFGTQSDRDLESAQIQGEMDSQESTDLDSDE